MFLPAGLITRQATSILKPAQHVVIANKSTNIPFSLILNEWVLAWCIILEKFIYLNLQISHA